MLLMHANNREDIKEAYAGDIVALAGLKDTRTGDTLCDPAKPAILEKMEFPEPVIEIAIEPKSKADQEKLGVALSKLAAEDPSFRVSTDPESGQTILKGMGELHLDIKVDILRRTYKVDANIGAPQVAYREKLTKKIEINYTHKKQSGGSGQFARVVMVFEPAPPGAGSSFESKVVGGAVPKEYIPGVEKGVNSVLGSGVLAGFPVVDVKATPDRRRLSRRRLVGLGVRNRVPRSPSRGSAEGWFSPARANHESGSRHPGRTHRLRDGRSPVPARACAGSGHAGQRRRDQRNGAAVEHVRLRQPVALGHAGTRELHNAV